MKRNILWSSIFAASILVTACKKHESNPVQKTSESVRDKMDKIIDRDEIAGSRQEVAQKTADFERSVNANMARLDAKIVKIDARGDAKSRELAGEFRARRDELKTKLQQLSDSTDDSIDSMESAITASWDRLEADVDSAL